MSSKYYVTKKLENVYLSLDLFLLIFPDKEKGIVIHLWTKVSRWGTELTISATKVISLRTATS